MAFTLFQGNYITVPLLLAYKANARDVMLKITEKFQILAIQNNANTSSGTSLLKIFIIENKVSARDSHGSSELEDTTYYASQIRL